MDVVEVGSIRPSPGGPAHRVVIVGGGFAGSRLITGSPLLPPIEEPEPPA